MKVSNPEHFPDVSEPDWEFEQDYLDAVESLKTQPREVRMIDGKALLRLLKEQPNEENKNPCIRKSRARIVGTSLIATWVPLLASFCARSGRSTSDNQPSTKPKEACCVSSSSKRAIMVARS
jgi:hypothetical protein